MAMASKRRPWVVQMQVPALPDKWTDIGAYRTEDEATVNAELARKRAPEAQWRVIEAHP